MDDVFFPQYLSSECRDLIRKMLTKIPQERISLEQIAKHPFCFQAIRDGGALCRERYGGMVGNLNHKDD